MYELHDLLAESNVISKSVLSPGRLKPSGSAVPVIPWIAAANVAAIYLLVAIVALYNPLPEEWPLISGPTTWTGLLSMAAVVFLAVGSALSAITWTTTHGSRRRFRPRQGRLLQV